MKNERTLSMTGAEAELNPDATKSAIVNKRRTILAKLRRLLAGRSEGGALVEMALVLPVMMLLITGMAYSGLACYSYLVLAHATDAGARYLAVGRSNLTDPCAQTVSVINTAANGLVISNLSYSFTIGSSGTLGSTCTTATSDMTMGSTATVTVTYSFPMIVFGWSPKSVSLKSSTAEIIQ